jgi:hypothetical protein
MPDKARPRTFKEVVAAEDAAERARRVKGESFEDVTVSSSYHREVSVQEVATAQGSGVSSISTRTAAATSPYLPVLKLRSGRAIISRRSDLDAYGPFEPKGGLGRERDGNPPRHL